MTANAFAKDRKMALSSGMDDYVSKPVDMNLLVPLWKNICKAGKIRLFSLAL